MGVFLHPSVTANTVYEHDVPESWQATEESYKCHQRHRHGEDDDVARERHGERGRAVLCLMTRIVINKSKST